MGAASGARTLGLPSTAPMPRSALVALTVLSLAGCDAFGPGSVRRAVVTSVRVTALDFDEPWDSPITNDRPDVYVDVKDPAATGLIGPAPPLWRSEVREDASAADLPLAFVVDGGVALPIDRAAQVDVADRDSFGDDLMASSGPFRPRDSYVDQERGDTGRIAFETDSTRIELSVRWE